MLRTILFTLLFSSTLAQARVLEKVHAVVNGETITLTEIKDYQKKLKTGGFLDELLFSKDDVRKKAMKDKKYLLKLLIDEKIIDYEVKQNGLLVTDARADKEINNIAKRQNLSVPQLRQALRGQGVDFDEYRRFVKQGVERRQLVEKEITSKIKISEQDIVSHYLAKNADGKSQVYEYSLSHILFNENDAETANTVAKALNEGASFSQLVKKHSVDDDTKNKGGDFGEFKSGEMIASIDSAVTPLEVGGVSKVVKTPMGLHVFKLTDKKLVKDPNIERQKQAIYQSLFAEAFQEQLDFWLIQKRKEAIIQINKS